MNRDHDVRTHKGGARAAIALAISGAMVVATAAEAAQGVLTKKRSSEIYPAADVTNGKLTLVWTQYPRGKPRKGTVFVRRGSGKARRVSPKGARAYSGGVDGRVILYQVVRNGDSDIKSFNWATGKRGSFRVNSRKWEFHPSKSGRWVLFGRLGARRQWIILLNTKNGNTRTLARRKGERLGVEPGQVNGNFAVYYKCNRRKCSVFRHRISANKTVRMPNKRRVQYAPSVARNGTVYFAGSGYGCGTRVGIYRRRNGKTSRIEWLGNKDTATTFAAPRFGGGTSVYYDRTGCNPDGSTPDRANFNVYRTRG